jgi:EAL domain-containing protein (putative c-di-GMP-specific phosphodiesterase class I)
MTITTLARAAHHSTGWEAPPDPVSANQFQDCLGDGLVLPFYQPVIQARSGSLESLEALARWFHPTRGLLGADAFVPALEQAGRIAALGRHMLLRATRAAVGWPTCGAQPPAVRVNVSASQLDDDGLVDDVAGALALSRLSPDRLVVEVTESTAIRAAGPARDVCDELRRIGVRLSLDDLGAGLSDAARLAQLPFDEVKVDRRFVPGIEYDRVKRVRLRRLVQRLADDGHAVTIEGVETRAQLLVVADIADVHVQGFLFGRPRMLDDAGDVRGIHAASRRLVGYPR